MAQATLKKPFATCSALSEGEMTDSWGPQCPKLRYDSDGDPVWSWELLGNKFYLGPVSNSVFGGLSRPIERSTPASTSRLDTRAH